MADIAELGFKADTSGLEKAKKSLDGVASSGSKASLEVDRYGNSLTKADKAAGRFIDSAGKMREKNGQFVHGLNESNGSLAKFDRLAVSVVSDLKNMAIAGTAVAGVFGAIAAANSSFNRELEAQARQAGETVSEYQKLVFAASQAGIEQDKFGDITKDVQDKVGDFLATGGGELADFFENIAPKVGVTADQFRGLSGAQALGLFVQTLDKANVSQEEAIFYTESLADEASRLRGVFGGTGEAIAEAGRKMATLGVTIDNLDVERSASLSSSFDLLGTTISNSTTKAVSAFRDEIEDTVNATIRGINLMSDGFIALFDQMRDTEARRSLKGIQRDIGLLVQERERLKDGGGLTFLDRLMGKDSSGRIKELNEEIYALQNRVVELLKQSSQNGKPLNLPSMITGKKDGGSGSSPVATLTDELAELEEQLKKNVDLYGKTEREIAKSEAREKALAAAKKKGIELSDEQLAKIEGLVDEYYNLKEAEEDAAKADSIKDRINSLGKYEKAWKEAQLLHEKGLLTDKELDQYREILNKMATTAGDAGKDAGDQFAGGFIDAADLGSALADSLRSGDFSAVGQSIGSSVGSSVSGYISGAVGGAAGSFLGELGGGLLGGLAGDLATGLFGGKKEQTGEGVRLSFGGDGVESGESLKSYKKKRALFRGTKRWTTSKGLSESDLFDLDAVADAVLADAETAAQALGGSVALFTGELGGMGDTAQDALAEYGDVIAQGTLGAADQFRMAGESYLQLLTRLGQTAETLETELAQTGKDLEDLGAWQGGIESRAEFSQSFADQVAEIFNVTADQALPIIRNLTQEFTNDWLSASEAAANSAEMTAEFFDTLPDVGLSITSTAEEIRAAYDTATTPEQIAGILAAADAISIYNDQMSVVAAEQAARDAEQAARDAEQAARDAEELSSAERLLSEERRAAAEELKAVTALEDRLFRAVNAGNDAILLQNDRQKELAAATSDAQRAILDQIYAQEDLNAASQQAAEIARKNAAEVERAGRSAKSSAINKVADFFDGVIDGVEASIRASEIRISNLSGIVSAASSAQKTLGGIDFNSALSRVSSAISDLRNGVEIDYSATGEALDDIASISADQFDTQEDFLYWQAVAANEAEALKNLAGEQLSAEERSIQALESQIAQLQENKDAAISSIDDLKAADAVNLERQLSKMDESNALLSQIIVAVGRSSAAQVVTQAAARPQSTEEKVRDAYKNILGLSGNFAGASERVGYWTEKLNSGAVSASAFESEFKAAASRLSESNAAKWGTSVAERQDVLGFATGGFTGMGGRNQVAGASPYDLFDQRSTMQSMMMVKGAVDGLRNEMRSALGNIASNTYQTAATLEGATRGGALATVVEQ